MSNITDIPYLKLIIWRYCLNDENKINYGNKQNSASRIPGPSTKDEKG